jgi:NADPH:quinone reductase-like Zn-dependent oxidoreductase
MKAVRFEEYGDIDVLKIEDIARPEPKAGEVLIKVKAAGINPGEDSIRSGKLEKMYPTKFPSGEGSDLAGVIEKIGEDAAGFKVGDEVFGFTDNRASQADYVVAEAKNIVYKPAAVT